MRLPLLLAVALWPCVSLSASPLSSSSSREAWVAALDQSVNIGRWWRHVPHDTAAHLARHVTFTAAQEWSARGVRTVRLLVHPEMLLDQRGAGGGVRGDRVRLLRHHVRLLNAAHLRVVVALHLEPARRLDDAIWRTTYRRLWVELAHAMRHVPTDELAYELASEPVAEGAERAWGMWQAELAAERRLAEPTRLLVLNPPRWSSLWTLESLPPIPDAYTVVGVHYYDPAVVTHQGASWGGPRVESTLAHVPFPPSESACAAAQAKSSDAVRALGEYCASDPVAEMTMHFDRLLSWREKTGIPVWLSEFGVIESAPSETRRSWLVAVTSAAAGRGVPWSLFAVDEGFGLRPTASSSPAWDLWAMLER